MHACKDKKKIGSRHPDCSYCFRVEPLAKTRPTSWNIFLISLVSDRCPSLCYLPAFLVSTSHAMM